ncbi:MAG TPA: glycogen/starch/alpha-glucan phosphorylase, partial [Polyangiaceae bacterium]|nr:glycogen/starch/alpha-glucan phosphorylase [Polyangiaceae bacterium]
SLGSSLDNLRLREPYTRALQDLGAELASLEEQEPDAALGNGGLGRLAACFLDSLATLDLPAIGYGINYEYGLFRQDIQDGYQRERPDNWLASGTPWQIASPEESVLVPVYGYIEHALDRRGSYNPMWLGWRVLVGIPHDMPIPGYGGGTINLLRLYSARASRDFDIQIFNDGDYIRAVEQKIASEAVSKVLYPSDAAVVGRELRLVQEYFLVACAIRDAVRRFERQHSDFRQLPEKLAIQMNDTHPALAVAELMRLLLDEKDLSWEEAWEATRASSGFTNHTLAPEALEKWPVPLLERVLPRHLQIIYEINRRFLEQVSTATAGDSECMRHVSLIEESAPQHVRMAHLAIVGSQSVNGVSKIHTELVQTTLAPDFFRLFPERFNNKTNGITPRRWLLGANPGLAALITQAIGDGWLTDLSRLRALEPLCEDSGFRDQFLSLKRSSKERLAGVIRGAVDLRVDPESLFDVQVKRIHGYKRQLLAVLHIVHEYLQLLDGGPTPRVARTYIFGGKAAPGYGQAKQIIKLIHVVASTINADGRANAWMKVAFLPDYRVSLAEKILPAADLSEQISTAGFEASGTSNMKLALNGAILLGTLDGANIEILAEVGAENAFTFGLDAQAVAALRRPGNYRPWEYYERDPRVRRVTDALLSNLFSHAGSELLQSIHRALLEPGDPYLHLADLGAYLDAHDRVSQAWVNRDRWARMALFNVARIGKFSSDRSIREYAREIWKLSAVSRRE